jgi:hypothetical protein
METVFEFFTMEEGRRNKIHTGLIIRLSVFLYMQAVTGVDLHFLRHLDSLPE